MDHGRFFPTHPGTFNRYLYTADDPLNKIDRDGLEAEPTEQELQGNNDELDRLRQRGLPVDDIQITGAGADLRHKLELLEALEWVRVAHQTHSECGKLVGVGPTAVDVRAYMTAQTQMGKR